MDSSYEDAHNAAESLRDEFGLGGDKQIYLQNNTGAPDGYEVVVEPESFITKGKENRKKSGLDTGFVPNTNVPISIFEKTPD